MAMGLLLAPPALAQNYAPGLPPAQPGVPNNPPNPAPIVEGVTLVPARVAGNTERRVVRQSPAARIGEAPRIRAERGRPLALVFLNSPPGTTWVVDIKRAGGTYNTLGSTVVTPNGEAVLPVFRPRQKGNYVLMLRNVQTGQVAYIKVRVD
jgi:hypothetical protein